MILAALLLQAVAVPGPEALELGRRVAASSMLARMIPMVAHKEAGEMIADHPELSASERAELLAIAEKRAEAGRARLVEAMGAAYAAELSIDDMRAIAGFNEGPVAARWKAAEPRAIEAAVQALGGIDFKAEVLKAMCAQTGKACPR